jgi:hypothetical protein
VLRYIYPQGWEVRVGPEGSVEEEDFFFAEGRCEGSIVGQFRAANHPRRRSDGPFLMNMQGFIEADDGAVIMADFQGYGRAYPVGRRQVVGAVKHLADDPATPGSTTRSASSRARCGSQTTRRRSSDARCSWSSRSAS